MKFESVTQQQNPQEWKPSEESIEQQDSFGLCRGELCDRFQAIAEQHPEVAAEIQHMIQKVSEFMNIMLKFQSSVEGDGTDSAETQELMEQKQVAVHDEVMNAIMAARNAMIEHELDASWADDFGITSKDSRAESLRFMVMLTAPEN